MNRDAYGDREAIFAALADAEAAYEKLSACSLDALTSEEILDVVERRETLAWRQPAVDHRLLARMVADGVPGKLGAASVTIALEERLRISRGAAKLRLAEAADLGPRRTLDGRPLEPVMPEVAAAQAEGRIGPEHTEIARDIYRQIPAAVTPEWRTYAEAELADLATKYRPAMFRRLGTLLLTVLDPDGDFADRARQHKRGLTLGPQHRDGTSTLSGILTPEARATLEPLLAKLAAPGMCNNADEHPCVSGTPTEEQIRGDERTGKQRNHDALLAVCRAMLASGDLGQHNGLPVTVIVTTTLAEMEAAAHAGAAGAGWAITAGGSRLPMSDLIRIGAHAVHYLSIFDGQGRALWLGRAKRLASADQRIVLIARDRGCTRPGCEANAYDCQAHHLDPFGKDGQTDVDELGQACGPDNRMADQYGWTTLLNAAGRVEWHPPPALDRGQARINATHFPEDLLAALRRRRAEQHGPPEPGPPLGPYSPVRPGEDPPGTAPSWFDDAVDTAGWGAYFDETDAELDELAVNHPEDACDDCPDLTDAEFEDLVRRDPERRYPPAC
ncbi:MAG: HNH endonuclease signature motif containing protein [Mycolicibacterium insubricum]